VGQDGGRALNNISTLCKHVMLVSALVSSFGVIAKGFSGLGSGTSWDPYIITNVNELQEMNNEPSAWYELGNDIDASDTINWNSGEGFVPISVFQGTFDGQGHNITDLFINRSRNFQGLFGEVGYILGVEVKNVGLINVHVSAGSHVGGLIGYDSGGTVENCFVTGCVIGTAFVGGLVGFITGGDTISNSYARVKVNGTYCVGGLVGQHYCDRIVNSYATGDVEGSYEVGGLVGMNADGTIENSYSTGKVIGNTNVGGLVGSGAYEGCTNSFWDNQTSNQSTSACGEGKTTSEMMQKDIFVNWDFVETWGIEDNQTYPFLKLTYPVGDLNYDKVVNFLDFAIFADHWLDGTGN